MITTASKRDQGIECLRGIAIILVVLGHVIGGKPEYGLQLPEDSAYRYFLYDWLIHIRMPLFTVISGYVYAMRPINDFSTIPKFLIRKSRRLLIPFLVAASLFFFFQELKDGRGLSEIFIHSWHVYIDGHVQYWFIQGIFLVFLLVAILDGFGWSTDFRQWLAVIVGVVGIYSLNLPLPSLFAIDHIPFLLMFFLFGLGLYRFEPQLVQNSRLLILTILLFGAGFLAQQYMYFRLPNLLKNYDQLFTLLIGGSGTFLLIHFRLHNHLFAKLGNYAYEIFLYHIFGVVIMRMLLYHLNIIHPVLHICLELLAGLFFPLCIKWVVLKSPYINQIVFGDRKKQLL